VRLALESPRPRNLIGMLLAPWGCASALLGVGRLLSPAFFGREARATGPCGSCRRAIWRCSTRPPRARIAAGTAGRSGRDRGTRGGLRGRDPQRSLRHRSRPRGVRGAAVDGLAAHLEADLPACAPDVILLYAGSVDLAAGAAPEVVVGRLSALIDATISRAPRAQLLVAALVGAAGIDPARVAAVNLALRQAVLDRAARGERVRFVDLAARVGKSELAADGVHLTERGYERVAEVWLEALGTQYPSGFEAAEVP
jgi:lysophospholipase L1-like esterase